MQLTFKQNKPILDKYELDTLINIEGICKHNIYISNDYTYGIYIFEDSAGNEFTVLSNTTSLIRGQSYFLHGKVVYNSKYKKRDFKLYDFIPYKPNTKKGIISFIETIPGLQSKAELIYNTFGDKTIDIILNSPEDLKQIKGIGKLTVTKVTENVTQFDTNYKTIISLLELGFTNNQVIKTIKTFGTNTLFKINQNPYALNEIRGLSYEFCDNIARKLNFDGEGSFRINAAANHILELSSMEGNTYLPKNEFIRKTKELLLIKYPYTNLDISNPTISYFGNKYTFQEKEIQTHIQYKNDLILKEFTEDEILDGIYSNIIIEDNKVFLRKLYDDENIFIEKIMELLKNRKPLYSRKEIETVLKQICKKDNIVLEQAQKEAVILSCMYDSGPCILNGSAGTGKTFITKIIVKTKKKLSHNKNLRFLGIAPTGKATKVMEKNFADLKIPCKTIHRALEYQGFQFLRDDSYPLEENFFILDEASMLDISLAKALLIAIQNKSTLLILGDVKQLPSIGPGNVLHDLIESNVIPTVELSVVKRQTALSGILKNAEHVINFESLETTEDTDDFYLISNQDKIGIQKSVIDEFKELFQRGFYLEDIELLIPQRTGPVGIYMFNYILQKEFNQQTGMKILKTTFEVNHKKYQLFISRNDKVMQTKNDYGKEMYIKKNGKLIEDHIGITNGEIGIVEDIYTNHNGEKIVEVKFDNYYALYTDLSDLELAYAITIHKSQGSQWPATLIIVSNSHRYMLTNNLIYTAITRSMDYCGIICEDTAVDYAIHTQKDIHRYSDLNEKLKKYI